MSPGTDPSDDLPGCDQVVGAPPPEFHYASVFDAETLPVDWRRLVRLWREGLALAVAASRRRVTMTSLLLVAAAGAAAARVAVYASVVGRLVNLDSAAPLLSPLVMPVVALGILFVIEQAAAAYQTLSNELMSEDISVEATRRILDAATSVNLLSFESPAFYDQLRRAESQASFRPVQIVQALQSLGRGGLTSLGIIGGIAVVSPVLLPLVVLVYAPAGLALMVRTHQEVRFVRGMTRHERERGYLVSLMTERFAANEIRVFALAGELRQRYERMTADYMDDLRVTKQRQAKAIVAGNFGSLALAALVLGSMALLFQVGRLPLAAAVASLIALQQLTGFVSLASFGACQLHEAGVFLDDYSVFLERSQAAMTEPGSGGASDGSAALAGVPTFQTLVADKIGFRYPGGAAAVLNNISLQVKAGQVVALVGENGSGKTTLAKILAGLYRPTNGRLLLDGNEAVPASVAVLFQDFVRYAFSGAENIGLGDSARLDRRSDIEAAARSAGAHDVLAGLSDGYDTRLTRQFEDGVDLSVGQWQRVAIARALFRDSALIILDEPTAALDPRAEAQLFDTMRTLGAGRTVILISHRFSTVRNADLIVVLAAGTITEHGTHHELMARAGTYAELFNLQASAFVSQPDARPGQ